MRRDGRGGTVKGQERRAQEVERTPPPFKVDFSPERSPRPPESCLKLEPSGTVGWGGVGFDFFLKVSKRQHLASSFSSPGSGRLGESGLSLANCSFRSSAIKLQPTLVPHSSVFYNLRGE